MESPSSVHRYKHTHYFKYRTGNTMESPSSLCKSTLHHRHRPTIEGVINSGHKLYHTLPVSQVVVLVQTYVKFCLCLCLGALDEAALYVWYVW